MFDVKNIFVRSATLALVVLFVTSGPASAGPTDPEEEIDRLRRLVEEVQPAAAELAGFPVGEPVEVAVKTREEVRDYMIEAIEISNPDGDLYRRGRCLSRIGLLPEGYDLEAGMVDLVTEQAGGLYDPFSKQFWGILNVQRALRAPSYQKLIASHELTHALQGRVTDIVGLLGVFMDNPDYEYAFRSVIEGMATVVMFAYTQDLGVDQVPDPGPIMRMGFEQKAHDPSFGAYARSPVYVKELLISPYAEGATFVQAWHRANPDLKLADLMKQVPASSEQVLHLEKFFQPDLPTAIDLSGIDKYLPDGWDTFYATTLGEFDLLTLFSLYGETEDTAAEIAAGWDGMRFRAFENAEDQIVLLGSSVWDSEEDAREFRLGFSLVLEGLDQVDDFTVVQNGPSVDFIIGSMADDLDRDLLAAVQSVARPDEY